MRDIKEYSFAVWNYTVELSNNINTMINAWWQPYWEIKEIDFRTNSGSIWIKHTQPMVKYKLINN